MDKFDDWRYGYWPGEEEEEKVECEICYGKGFTTDHHDPCSNCSGKGYID